MFLISSCQHSHCCRCYFTPLWFPRLPCFSLKRCAHQSLLLSKVVATALSREGSEDRPRFSVGWLSREGVYEAHSLWSWCPAETGKHDTCSLGRGVLQTGWGRGLWREEEGPALTTPWGRAAMPQMLTFCSSLGLLRQLLCLWLHTCGEQDQ